MKELYIKHFIKEVNDYKRLGLSKRAIKMKIRNRLIKFSHLDNTKNWNEFFKFVFEKKEFSI